MASAHVRDQEEQCKLHDAHLAAGNDGVLPTDVLHEVLLRLPANVLCRLRLVCRSWRLLTSDPTFAKAHASRHALLAGIVRDDQNLKYEVRVVDLSGNIIRRAPLLHPCYSLSAQVDLVCVSSLLTRSSSSMLDLAAGEVVALLSSPTDEGITMSALLLAHIPSTGELKVFCSRKDTTRAGRVVLQDCYVTTLGGGTWWRWVPSLPAMVASDSRERVAIAGVMYFLLHPFYNNDGDNEPDAIAVFDLAAEEWRPATLQGPLSSRLAGDDDGKKKLVYREHRNYLHLAVLDGCLVTVQHNYYQDHCSMDLWFLLDMDVDKGLWTKRFSICCAPPYEQYTSSSSYPLILLDDGRIVMWEERIQDLRLYDPRTRMWAELATSENFISVDMYRGNLLCPRLHR